MSAGATSVRPRPDEAAATLGRAGTVGIIALAALRMAEAALWFTAAIGVSALPNAGGIAATASLAAGSLLMLTFGAVDVVCGVGLLMSWRWGWILTMLVIGGGLASEILSVLAGEPGYLRLAILVVSAFFLNQRPVRVRFGISTP